MSDDDDGEWMDDDAAAEQIGCKVMEMIEKLAFVPIGTEASTHIELDGRRYRIVLSEVPGK